MSQQEKQSNILIFDIETSPNLAYMWGIYEQNALSVQEEWFMLCFAAKWLGQKKSYVHALPDYKESKYPHDDAHLVEELWHYLDKADVVIAHNGDKFDIRKTNARFIANGFPPPSPYQTIDTLKVARKHFKFDSNRLDDLGQYLGVGEKAETGGFKLWLECMAGDAKAWSKMKKYNKQDVNLLERVYLALRPWMTSHPNRALLEEEKEACPACASTHVQRRGYAYTNTQTYQQWQCQDCGKWSRSRLAESIPKPELK